MLYGYYELHYMEKTAIVLCSLRRKYSYFDNDIELLKLLNGCLRLKFSSIRNSESSGYPVKVVYLNQDFDMPKELDYLCANTLIMVPSKLRHRMELTASLEMATKLKLFGLCNVLFNYDAFSIISSLSLTGFIQLESCKVDNYLFEKCTMPQKIQLINCKFSDPRLIRLPLSLEIFKISPQEPYKVDASDCIKLKSL
jgi:hypothetical protein